ncbi:unnamed protein product [Microthlaspi erraticum]|uniref:RNase H type-1 domain-containing protein n=1 Tax=Microthlaspi erraticum TaxID=1685480 RepID=A0A6D2IFM6_9BRAS|nr:unnamed protein product [Microthlaspi erraticum]
MPVFSMSCFKLPANVTDEISNLLMRFWWDKGDRNKGIPWVAWKRLQFSKKDGGLGFRDLPRFNDALLAKQAWRLLKHPDTPFARLMKARYYKDTSILEAKHRINESYGWSSIVTGLTLLKKGMKHIVGDGESTNVFEDLWLPVHPPRRVTRNEGQEDFLVKELIIDSGCSRKWNLPVLEAILNAEDRNLVQKLYLPQRKKQDRQVWCYDKSGDYTVKSGYWLAFREHLHDHPEITIPHGDPVLKDQIWRLQIMPKIKHFFWRALSKALPTATRLVTRGMKIDKGSIRLPETPPILACLADMEIEMQPNFQETRSSRFTSPTGSTDLALPTSSRKLPWQRPTLGYFKCNFDASYDLHSQQSMAGWIIRDHNGVAFSWGTTNLGVSNSPLEAEAKALLIAMQQTWSLGLDYVVFEGDCKLLIDSLQGNPIDFNIENICWDIDKWRRDFKECVFLYTRRENNMVAHSLASTVPPNDMFYSSSSSSIVSRIYVVGYDIWLSAYELSISLRKHFASCGEVLHVHIPGYSECSSIPTGLSRFALIYLRGEGAEDKALKLSGRRLKLIVEVTAA